MTSPSRVAAGVLAAALAALAATGPATAAPAPTRSWTVVESGFGAKQEACKIPVDDGTAWRVLSRLDARRVTGGRLHATLTVTHDGDLTGRTWGSGWVRPGQVSDVGAVRLPRRSGWALQMTLGGDNAGSGGTLGAADIGRC